MVTVQSFPLFRLPTLAYENVIDILHLKEKFDLSVTSKKVTLIFKRYNQIRKHKLMIFPWCDCYSARIYVYIDRGDNSNIKDSNSWVYNLGDDNNVIVDPMITQVTHIANIAPTASLRLKFADTHPDVHTTFIPLAERLSLTLNSVEMCFIGAEPDDDMFRYVFENCRHAQTLMYHRNTTNGFTMDPDSMGSYSFDFLDISYGPWITTNHLKKCFNNCKYVELSNTKLSSQELNAFLTQWIQGSKIQELWLGENEHLFEMAYVLVGITSVSHPYVHDKTFSHVATPGYVIKNIEGLEAVIHLTEGYFFLTTNFTIVDENYSLEVSFNDEEEEEDYDGED
ncbi:unnamed protein product [Caenorhabditis brenneri]